MKESNSMFLRNGKILVYLIYYEFRLEHMIDSHVKLEDPKFVKRLSNS